jgi:dipicolinate synthase subunit A
MLVRFAVLREQPRWGGIQSPVGPVAIAEQADEPWRRQLSVGHGCSGPDLTTPSASAIDMGYDPAADRQHATPPISVCVVGSGDIAMELADRLLTLGLRVHATAETVEDYVAMRSAGAVPHRFDDMPAVAAGIDLLVSTSFSRFVGATVVARLRDSAQIIDLARAPGSVDFETSRRLGHQPIWVPSSTDDFEDCWGVIQTQIELISIRRNRT